MTQDLLHAINLSTRPRIVVVGDLVLDRYIHGDVSRISPEAPIPVLAAGREEFRLGGAANVAANIASMGGHAHLIGVLGADAHGKRFAGLARACKGLTLKAVTTRDRPTIVKTRLVAQNQQMLRVDAERVGPLAREHTQALLTSTQAAIVDADLVVVSDYGKNVVSEALMRAVIRAARARKVPVLVDPKGTDYTKYRGATVVTPNRHEAELATGISLATENGIRKCATALHKQLGLQASVITLGAGGVAVYSGKQRFTRIPTLARSVFDVTGAGDTFIATLGVFLAMGVAVEEAAALANAAAGIKVGRFGAAAITRDELRRSMLAAQEAFDHHSKIVSREDLHAIVQGLRREGRKIVFTNGCFDILHAGHVTYLHFCKAQGEVLVLGLNSDASVRAIKGESRPVNHEQDRARVLAALADVDFVCVFGEDTPEKLIADVRPDVLVKGADWKGKQVAGAASVRKHGGQVVFAPLLPGRSTSATIRKLEKQTDDR